MGNQRNRQAPRGPRFLHNKTVQAVGLPVDHDMKKRMALVKIRIGGMCCLRNQPQADSNQCEDKLPRYKRC
ncbi:hypothetical protein MesoLj113a_45010 [Mesorhizobium sp. 113-1-2]|nr:hypothetical protein MesoLj113a_45010 [Mesorhizobium sp. 113-1-2]